MYRLENELERTQQKLTTDVSMVGHQEDAECSDGHVHNSVSAKVKAVTRNRPNKFNKNKVRNESEFETTQKKLITNVSRADHQEDVECSDGHVHNSVSV